MKKKEKLKKAITLNSNDAEIIKTNGFSKRIYPQNPVNALDGFQKSWRMVEQWTQDLPECPGDWYDDSYMEAYDVFGHYPASWASYC